MLFAPAAFPTASMPTEPTTEFCAAGMAIDTPTPATISGTTNSPYDMPGSAISAIHTTPVAWRSRPPAMNGRSPTRSDSVPASGATVMKVAVQGIRRSPASSAP